MQLNFNQLLLPVFGMAMALLLVVAVVVFVTSAKLGPSLRRSWVSRLIYLVFVASIFVLSSTSFGSIVTAGHMERYALVGHMVWAGAFTFLLPFVATAYLWPRHVSLPPNSTGSATEIADNPNHRSKAWWLETFSAWWLVIAALVTASTMFLSMLPVLGTDGLIQVNELHRYFGLATAVGAIFHLFSLLAGRLRLR